MMLVLHNQNHPTGARRLEFGVVLAVLCLMNPAPACTLPEGPARAVVSVIDGDTLLLDDQTKLRLGGGRSWREGTDEAELGLVVEQHRIAVDDRDDGAGGSFGQGAGGCHDRR